MPLRAWWAWTAQVIRCAGGLHEYAAEAPVDQAGRSTGVLRRRCLHCGQVTAGWEMSATPGYTRTQEPDLARLRLHNGRLRRCACGACETRRRERGQRPRVTRIKGVA